MSIIKKYKEGGTELNKLKFKGNMGGGHPGNPPLIQKRVPNESKEASIISGTGLSKRLDDVGRIAQLFARREGLGFLANNTALNLTPGQANNQQPRNLTELRSNLANSITDIPNALKDTQLTLASTLASIPVAGTGAHFVKGNLVNQAYLSKDYVQNSTLSPLEKLANRDRQEGADPRIKQHYYSGNNSDTNLTPEDYKPQPFEFQSTKRPKKTSATVSIGDPARTKSKYDKEGNFYFNTSNYDAVDKVNNKYPFTSTSGFEAEPDYVKFLFEVLDPTPVNATEADPKFNSTFLQFRAFIDSISDNYNANWNSYNYVGRGESFHTYSSFGRDITISFKSAVATREELVPVYRKLNLLASTTAPSYSTNGIMRGTIVRMTVGNYIFDTPGYLSSVSFTWNTSYQWEIEGDQLPHALDCNISFTPIHTFVPQTLAEKYIATNETI